MNRQPAQSQQKHELDMWYESHVNEPSNRALVTLQWMINEVDKMIGGQDAELDKEIKEVITCINATWRAVAIMEFIYDKIADDLADY